MAYSVANREDFAWVGTSPDTVPVALLPLQAGKSWSRTVTRGSNS
jgi:hypothetical protein